MTNTNAGLAQLLDNATVLAERQYDDVDVGFEANRDMAPSCKVHQQVCRDSAAWRVRAHLVDRIPQLTGHGQAERSKAARFSYRGRQRRARQPAAHLPRQSRWLRPNARWRRCRAGTLAFRHPPPANLRKIQASEAGFGMSGGSTTVAGVASGETVCCVPFRSSRRCRPSRRISPGKCSLGRTLVRLCGSS